MTLDVISGGPGGDDADGGREEIVRFRLLKGEKSMVELLV